MAADPQTPDPADTAQHAVEPATRPRPPFFSLERLGHSPMLRFVAHRTVRLVLAVAVVALTGAGIGVVLGGTVHHAVGPVQATFRLRLATDGGSRVAVPPLGTIKLHDHAGPLALRIAVDQVDLKQAEALISSTESADAIGNRLEADVRTAVIELAVRSALCGLAGAVVLTLLVFRRPGLGGLAVGVVVLLVVVSGGIAAATFRTSALTEPRFSGILASAPSAIGDVQDIEARFTAYREELAKLVTNVSKLYDVASTLPAAPPSGTTTAVLWVSDIHDNPEAFNVMQSLVTQFGVAAIVDSGDISDHGLPAENALYAPVGQLKVPYVYIKGNHDSTKYTVAALEKFPNVRVLDNTATTVAGITFTGIGDPRFTPDKTTQPSNDQEQQMLTGFGQRLTTTAEADRADVAVIHDPAMSGPLMGHVPLVLAGHLHKREVQTGNGTLLLVQGSTGGAGLRNLEGSTPLDLDASILYFDTSTHRLIAYDDVTVGGLGLTSVQIQRHAVNKLLPGGTNPVPPSAAPSASASVTVPASPSVGASDIKASSAAVASQQAASRSAAASRAAVTPSATP